MSETNGSFLKRVKSVLSNVECDGYKFITQELGWRDAPVLLHVAFMAIDVKTGENELQKGRKWYLSSHMTDSEIVQTAFLAVKVAQEHELREVFKYKNQAIFGPHFSLESLATFALLGGERVLDVRPDYSEFDETKR